MVLPTNPNASAEDNGVDEILRDMMEEERYYGELRSQMEAAHNPQEEPTSDTAGLTLPRLRSL